MSSAAGAGSALSRYITSLHEVGGLKGRDIANIVGVSPPTVSRWKQGETSAPIDKQKLVAELRWIVEQLAAFYEPDETRLWLQMPHPQLNMRCPHDLIREGKTGDVLEVIERLESSTYL